MFFAGCDDQTSKSLVWDLEICIVFVQAGFSSQFIINRKLKLHQNSIEKIFSRNIINNTAEASYHNTLNIKIYRRNSNTSAYFNLTNKYLILIKRFLSNNSSSCFYFLPFNISGSRSDHLQVVTLHTWPWSGAGLLCSPPYHPIFSPSQTELPPVIEDYSNIKTGGGMMTARPGQAGLQCNI